LLGKQVSGPLCEIMAKSGLFESKGAVRRLIQQGGVKVDGEKQEDPNRIFTPNDGVKIFQAGKRIFFKLLS